MGIARPVDALTALLTYSMQKRQSISVRCFFTICRMPGVGRRGHWRDPYFTLRHALPIDPAITIGIAGYILYLGLTEIGGTIRTLMPAARWISIPMPSLLPCPTSKALSIFITAFWQMGEHDASLEAHVIIEESAWDQLRISNTGYKNRLWRRNST